MTPEHYKNTLKCFASGVTVLSWRDTTGNIQGITVSAFTSLSLDPPLVLFCIDRGAYVYPELSTREHLAINILADGQQALAYQFAGANRNNLEEAIHEENPHGQPYLHGAHANLLVKIENVIAGGDHDIFIARLIHSDIFSDRLPLIYHNGKL